MILVPEDVYARFQQKQKARDITNREKQDKYGPDMTIFSNAGTWMIQKSKNCTMLTW